MGTTNSRLKLNNYLGCLLGGAVGDALGAPIEFYSMSEIRRFYGNAGVTGFVEFPDNKGEFTDDTQMTLFTAEGLLTARQKEIKGELATIIHQSYLRWLHTQGYPLNQINQDDKCGQLTKRKELFKSRAPGNTCIGSLRSGKMGSIENPLNRSKGCGGLMRIAPVGLIKKNDPDYCFKLGCEIAAITHGHPTGYLSAGFLASILSQLSFGINLDDAIYNSLEILKKWNEHEETLMAIEKAISLWITMKNTDYQNTTTLYKELEQLGAGWTGEEALSISLFCSLLFQNDFIKGVLAAVNHSGDCDSTGSITGNILGFINGLKVIPSKWIENLNYSDIVREIAEDLYYGFNNSDNDINNEFLNKYA